MRDYELLPAADAESVLKEAERIMSREIEGIPFRAEGEIGKRSRGSLKGGDE